jgi:hypothetical protein
MPLAWLLARTPDPALLFFGRALGAVQPILKRVGLSLPTAMELFSEPNTHIPCCRSTPGADWRLTVRSDLSTASKSWCTRRRATFAIG